MCSEKVSFLQGRSCGVAVLSYSTDGDLRITNGANSYIYFLQEVKNEVGQGGTIPALESLHYWTEQIRITLASGDSLLAS